MKILRIALILLIALVALTIGYWIYGTRGANGSYAKVELDGFMKPMTIAVNVFDSSGSPVSGASIKYENSSGEANELTDSKGFIAFDSSETEVIALHVNGRIVWNTPYRDKFLDEILLPPSCVNGLSFTVNLKAE